VLRREHPSDTASHNEPRNADSLVDQIYLVNVPEKHELHNGPREAESVT
jgi:hypothetical protein